MGFWERINPIKQIQAALQLWGGAEQQGQLYHTGSWGTRELGLTELARGQLVSPVYAERRRGLGPQGKGHMALKEIAKEFLAEQGLESSAELSFLGVHPDILSKDFSWIVECGTTVPVSILFFLRDERIKNIGILPYPYEDEKKLTLHVFSRGKNFDQHVTSRIVRLRTAFEKFHRKSS